MKKLIVVLAVAGAALTATSCRQLKARDQLNKGVQSYKNAQYPEAVEHFKTAVELDPNFPTARLYLATAYMSQYIPGADSPENLQMAQAAHDQFQKVLDQDPKNEVAIASIASLFFNQKKLDEAKQWYERLISVNPQNKEAYYTLGVIRLLVLRIHGDQPFVPLLGLIQLLLVEEQRRDRSDGHLVLRILIQNFLELVVRRLRHLQVLRRIRTRDVLAHVSGG